MTGFAEAMSHSNIEQRLKDLLDLTYLVSAGWTRPPFPAERGPVRSQATPPVPLEADEQAYKLLQVGSGPRGKVLLDVSAP